MKIQKKIKKTNTNENTHKNEINYQISPAFMGQI